MIIRSKQARAPLVYLYVPEVKFFIMQNDNFTVIPTISIHPDRITYFKQVVWSSSRRRSAARDFLVPAAHPHSGNVSSKASRKIQKAITYLITCSKVKPLNSWKHQKVFPFRLAFITLTLPSKQIHDDKEIMHSCFHQFLVEAKKKWKVHNYVWRAERQKNGNIHFHVLVDRFVPWSELRDQWNRLTEKLGYVSRYGVEQRAFHAGGFRARAELLALWSYKKQIRAYHEGRANDWRSPNSTDVHAVKKVNNIKAYVCKYMLKSSQADSDINRLWGCSYELSRAKGCQIIIDSHIDECLRWLRFKLKPKEISFDHCSVMFIDWWQFARAGITDFTYWFREYILEAFHVKLAI